MIYFGNHLPILTFLFFFGNNCLFAQPKNDHCINAINIKDVSNWCSEEDQFSNFGAQASGIPEPQCFPNFFMDLDNDVWFKFKSTGTIVNISVIGRIRNNPKGTLRLPQIALYKGSCMELREVACISDAQGYNITETFARNLMVGATYYLRVDGRNNQMGTFQLCINNFNEVPSPSSDCPTGVVLCDKSPFTVPNVIGAGKLNHELGGVCIKTESSSSWYKWTCDQPGTLTFTLKPVNPADDIDFAIYALPGGVDDCSFKLPLRCVASGENLGQPPAAWINCTGATGLRLNSTDYSEEQGCVWTDDNFVAAINMRAGESYALIVNNFHNTGNGFSIEFGGTGTFVGPTANFKFNKLSVEIGQKIKTWDASTFPGGIKKWKWNFGEGAKPQTARGKGPHYVNYTSPGKKSVSLTIETATGCNVSKVRNIRILKKKPPPPPPPIAKEENPEKKDTPKKEVEKTVETNISKQKELLKKPEPPTDMETSTNNMPSERTENRLNTSSFRKKAKKDTIITNWKAIHTIVLYYDSDSFNLVGEHKTHLRSVIQKLNGQSNTIALVEGHTNGIPHKNYCLELSKNRSTTVINYLATKGISNERLKDKVIGKAKPQETNKSLWGRKKNQRTVVMVLEPDDD